MSGELWVTRCRVGRRICYVNFNFRAPPIGPEVVPFWDYLIGFQT